MIYLFEFFKKTCARKLVLRHVLNQPSLNLNLYVTKNNKENTIDKKQINIKDLVSILRSVSQNFSQAANILVRCRPIKNLRYKENELNLHSPIWPKVSSELFSDLVTNKQSYLTEKEHLFACGKHR